MRIVHYDAVCKVFLSEPYYSNKKTKFDISHQTDWFGVSKTRGKMACIATADYEPYDIPYDLDLKLRYNSSSPLYKKIYVSPSCMISRDLLRKSYQIVRKRDSADCIVVPEKVNSSVKENARFVLLMHDETVDAEGKPKTIKTLLLCDWTSYPSTAFTNKEVLDAVTEYFKYDCPSATFENIYIPEDMDEDREQKSIFFIPAVQEYEEILLGIQSPIPYLYETRLDYTPVTTITPELLWIWRRENKDELVVKNMMNADWGKYPFTITMFSICKFGRHPVSKFIGSSRIIADTLGLADAYDNLVYGGQKKDCSLYEISPEDMKMLQDWIFKELGIEGDSGFITTQQINQLPIELRKYLLKKWVVRKIKITKPVVAESVKQFCC